jgi:hypothetical protein
MSSNKRSVLVACAAIIGVTAYALHLLKTSGAYYRLKYYTVEAHGSSKAAARAVCRANPFFNQRYAVLIDMALPSSEERLQVIDLQKMQPSLKTRVMHGRNSGSLFAAQFSNRMGSNKSSLGRYVVIGKYMGRFGQAYRLAGLDNSNSNALARSIVLHSSKWVSVNRVGRSQGCPTVSVAALTTMKPYLQEGTLVWIYR